MMNSRKITQDEADGLLKMLKRSMIDEFEFPCSGETKEFDVIGTTPRDVFKINIFRGKINLEKYNMGARITKNGLMLLELHINPTNIHQNPDGTCITGDHWHLYTENYDRLFAFPAENIDSEKFVENTILFLDKFNVIEKPEIHSQLMMF